MPLVVQSSSCSRWRRRPSATPGLLLRTQRSWLDYRTGWPIWTSSRKGWSPSSSTRLQVGTLAMEALKPLLGLPSCSPRASRRNFDRNRCNNCQSFGGRAWLFWSEDSELVGSAEGHREGKVDGQVVRAHGRRGCRGGRQKRGRRGDVLQQLLVQQTAILAQLAASAKSADRLSLLGQCFGRRSETAGCQGNGCQANRAGALPEAASDGLPQ